MTTDKNNKDCSKEVQRLTKELFDELNRLDMKAAIVVVFKEGQVVTRKTDAFESISDYIGIWEVAKFQECISLWKINPGLSQTYEESSGNTLGV